MYRQLELHRALVRALFRSAANMRNPSARTAIALDRAMDELTRLHRRLREERAVESCLVLDGVQRGQA